MKKKIAILLSGGVDSSVALRLLKDQGQYDLVAFYLKIWLEDELSFLGECPWEDDLKYAKAVCESLDIPLKVVPLQSEYHKEVVSYVISELKQGRTPSPDILCNQRIKFGLFLKYIGTDFVKIASGHYATVEEKDGQYWLKRGVDPVKDQSYFLSHLSQEQLSRCLFPIGVFTKSQIRTMAHEFNLPNCDRPDSQGICFLGKIKYNDFVQFHLGESEGEIIEIETGKKLGKHNGYWFHTVGQRKGLGLSGGPWFVVGKDVKTNVIYVSHLEKYVEHASDTFEVEDLHWINGFPKTNKLLLKVRHGPKLYNCELTAQSASTSKLKVVMDTVDTGIASGQFAVFYDGEYCIGSGTIIV